MMSPTRKVPTMNHVVLASTEADATAAAAVEQHHAQMAGALAIRAETLLAAASRGDEVSASAAKSDLLAWCEHELMPHALAEERAMYPAAHSSCAPRGTSRAPRPGRAASAHAHTRPRDPTWRRRLTPRRLAMRRPAASPP